MRDTSRSRSLFAASLRRQNAALVLGLVACLGQPCQKQPSTKTASLIAGKIKSGLPNTGLFRRQPVILFRLNNFASAISVASFPRERMRDITSDRFALVKMSGIFAGSLVDQLRGSERALGNGDIPGIHPLVPRTDFYKIIPAELMDGFQRPVFGQFHDEDILKQ